MKTWKEEIQDCLRAFDEVARHAGVGMDWDTVQVDYHAAPHRPSSLPKGKMAVYGFWCDGAWLKIGIAGNKSGARFTSQHYKVGRAKSSLALSLCNDAAMAAVDQFSNDDPGTWIRSRCHRLNILLPELYGRPLLALLEAFLHVKLKPRYER